MSYPPASPSSSTSPRPGTDRSPSLSAWTQVPNRSRSAAAARDRAASRRRARGCARRGGRARCRCSRRRWARRCAAGAGRRRRRGAARGTRRGGRPRRWFRAVGVRRERRRRRWRRDRARGPTPTPGRRRPRPPGRRGGASVRLSPVLSRKPRSSSANHPGRGPSWSTAHTSRPAARAARSTSVTQLAKPSSQCPGHGSRRAQSMATAPRRGPARP